MAATTISYAPGDGGFQTARATMDANAANVREIKIPVLFRRVSLFFLDSGGTAAAAKVSHTGTDGSAMGAAYMTVAAGTYFTVPPALGRSQTTEITTYRSIYVSGLAAGICEVAMSTAAEDGT